MKLIHITERSSWEDTQSVGMFLGQLEMDGFIHLSNPDQVVRLANMILLLIDRTQVLGEIRDEDLNGLGEAFPHLYAALRVSSPARRDVCAPSRTRVNPLAFPFLACCT
jgi:uncharacterized protein (DUF952 family)